MTDNTLTSNEIKDSKQKVKAIYPHITVSGTVDKPCYNIDWYDIEKQTMYRGFSSYKLPLVYEWLQEEFEEVEADIDDLINRPKAEIERLERHTEMYHEVKAEAVKECIEKIQSRSGKSVMTDHGIQVAGSATYWISEVTLYEIEKEMVGDTK